jgi:hypothetical protein
MKAPEMYLVLQLLCEPSLGAAQEIISCILKKYNSSLTVNCLGAVEVLRPTMMHLQRACMCLSSLHIVINEKLI